MTAEIQVTAQPEPKTTTEQAPELPGVVATGISEERYMEHYAAHFYEWAEGSLIKMSPVHEVHDDLTQYFILLLRSYFALRPIGQIRIAPFVQKLERRREPDLMIVLGDNQQNLKPTFMDGPADICIEIASPGSEANDYGFKMVEYEQGGVREYWLIDPQREICRFYQRGNNGLFGDHSVDADGNYTTMLLPDLRLHVPTLWTPPLPNPIEVIENVKAMLG